LCSRASTSGNASRICDTHGSLASVSGSILKELAGAACIKLQVIALTVTRRGNGEDRISRGESEQQHGENRAGAEQDCLQAGSPARLGDSRCEQGEDETCESDQLTRFAVEAGGLLHLVA